MANDLFQPRADMVDEDLFIETRQTAAATAALWEILLLSRQEPAPWMPLVVLCGEHGAGTTALARRFGFAARRNVACDLVAARLGNLEAERAREDREARARAFEWAHDQVFHHGVCRKWCQPAAWLPEHFVAQALAEAQQSRPTINLEMRQRPDRWRTSLAGPEWDSRWDSPGNRTSHPTRKTSIAFVDQADRLLSVPPGRRRECVDRIRSDASSRVDHALTLVLVGTPALAACVSEFATTQIVRLDAMANDAGFAAVAGMVFGTRDPGEVAALHTASRGLMGPLVHIARMRGFEPPFSIPPDEILRLPSPKTADGTD